MSGPRLTPLRLGPDRPDGPLGTEGRPAERRADEGSLARP